MAIPANYPLFVPISLIICLTLAILAWLKWRKAESNTAIANDAINQLTETGFAGITFALDDGKIISKWGIINIFDEEISGSIKNADDFYELLRHEDAEKLRQLIDEAKKSNDAQNLIFRLKNNAAIKCFIHFNNKHRYYNLSLRSVHSEYQKMLSAIGEGDALKNEKKLHSALLNNAPVPMWIRNAKLQIIYCNLHYMQMIEENDDSLIDNIMPSLFKGAERIAFDAFDGKKTASNRHRLVIDGARLLWKITEIYVPEIDGTIGFAQDISNLEKAEHTISEQLSTLEDLLDSSSSAMIIYGADMRLKFYNQAYVRIWGIEEAWLDSEPTFAEMIEHLRELRRLPEQINFKAFKQQRLKLFNEITEPQEELFYLPDGRTLRNVGIPHSAGGVLFIYEDVTDKLALERSYNTLIAVQRETLDNLHEGVVVFGEDGRMRLKNPIFLSLWDLDEKEPKDGIHISQLLDKTRHLYNTSNWELFKQEWIGLTQDRERHSLRFERTDGAVLDCSVVPLPDGGVLITYTDNTAATLVERSLRERNEALEAGDKLKSEFLANMSYELRSPLTSISGFAEMLRHDYFGSLSDKQREYVEGIHNSSQHLMHLINDILDLSSIEAGYMTLNITEFNIYKLLHTMTNLLSERLIEFKITHEIECKSDIGVMKADETRIRQILFHLISNSVKYSNEGGHVIIGANKTDYQVIIWVKDNGIGISENEQSEVFNKFYRGSVGMRKQGVGLGLSMVKSFVELHGGYVELQSEHNEGTTVTCYLPITTLKSEENAASMFLKKISPSNYTNESESAENDDELFTTDISDYHDKPTIH
jgi:signal transduction histidine kinase